MAVVTFVLKSSLSEATTSGRYFLIISWIAL